MFDRWRKRQDATLSEVALRTEEISALISVTKHASTLRGATWLRATRPKYKRATG